MSKRLKTIPKFSSEAAERTFWEKNDSSKYLDWSRLGPKNIQHYFLA
jgi:CopG antitoxin of type II toxin-antitoxin system